MKEQERQKQLALTELARLQTKNFKPLKALALADNSLGLLSFDEIANVFYVTLSK